MKKLLFQLVTSGLLILTMGTLFASVCQAREVRPVARVGGCSEGTDSFVRALTEKKLEVKVSSVTVTRADNPTQRKKVLVFVIGPASNSTVAGEEQAWAAAQNAVVSVTLAQVRSVIAGCPDVAEVHVGLRQSDFIREFAVTAEGANAKPLSVIERVCVDESASTNWKQQPCL